MIRVLVKLVRQCCDAVERKLEETDILGSF